jgi:hypothetical protein
LLSSPVAPPPGLGSTFRVYPEKDIHGSIALSNDPKVFSRVELREPVGAVVFWQIEPQHGKRLAVFAAPLGWRGDRYSVYVLDSAITPEALRVGVEKAEAGSRSFSPILEKSWNPPLILSDNKTSDLWFISFGEPYQILPNWRVHMVEQGAFYSPCEIVFRPPIKTGASLLPGSVRRFAELLDEALGPDTDGGTLHAISRVRLDVQNAWANASLRPWSLIQTPYNTREEVEAGLEQWAAGSARRTALYGAIRRQRPDAERELAAYYAKRFGLRPDEARRASAHVLDHVFRSNFAFHSETAYGRPETTLNPWPERTARSTPSRP